MRCNHQVQDQASRRKPQVTIKPAGNHTKIQNNGVCADLTSWLTIAALVLNAAALAVATRQLWLNRRGTSAGALVALNESFRQSWLVFKKAENEDDKQHTFADVVNAAEVACSIFNDKLFVGKSGKLLEDYLCKVFYLIQNSDDARQRIQKMLLTPEDFEHIVSFLAKHRKQIRGIEIPVREDHQGPC